MWDRIITTISLDATGFEAGAKRVESASSRLSGVMSGKLKSAIAGAFSVGVIAAFTKKSIEAAAKIQDLSDQFDMTTDAVQQLDFAAKQVGLSFDDVASKMDKMEKARSDALGGNMELVKSFLNIGIGLDALQDKTITTTEMFQKMAAAFSGGSGSRTDLMNIFGKGGGKMSGVFKSMQENAGVGAFISQDDIAAIDKFSDALSKATTQVEGFWATVIGKVIDNASAGIDESRLQQTALENLQEKHGKKSFLSKLFFVPKGSEVEAEKQRLRQVDYDSTHPKIATKKERDSAAYRKEGDSLFNQILADEFQRKLKTEELNKAALETDKARSALAMKVMTNSEKQNMLYSQRLEIMDKMTQALDLQTHAGDMEAERLQKALYENAAQALTTVPKPGEISADSLAKVGGFVGGAAGYDPSLSIQSQSLQSLRHMEDLLKLIADVRRDAAGKNWAAP